MIPAPGRLRAAGLRVTPRRVAILDALVALGGHSTADEVAAALGESGSPLPRASLYHALGAMADAGVLLVADAGPGRARFEVAGDWHHHLVVPRLRLHRRRAVRDRGASVSGGGAARCHRGRGAGRVPGTLSCLRRGATGSLTPRGAV